MEDGIGSGILRKLEVLSFWAQATNLRNYMLTMRETSKRCMGIRGS
jgi:hypothetical protein